MSKIESIMNMTPQEIANRYQALFKSSNNQILVQPVKDAQYTFEKPSILKDTSVSYSPSAQV